MGTNQLLVLASVLQGGAAAAAVAAHDELQRNSGR
jgi:hypothetical protein